MYTGRAIKSNIEWLIIRIRTARNHNPLGKSSIIFKSIRWSSRALLSSSMAIVNLVHPSSSPAITLAASTPKTTLEISSTNLNINNHDVKCDHHGHRHHHQHDNFDNSTAIKSSSAHEEEISSSELECIEDILLKSDVLFENNRLKESKMILDNISDNNLPEIKWRQARLLYSLAKLAKDKNEKISLIQNAYNVIKSALDICNENFSIHKWMAIILDAKVELDGFKERIMQICKIRQHMEYAVKLNPYDPTSWYFLGAYEFGLADLPWLHKKLINLTLRTSSSPSSLPSSLSSSISFTAISSMPNSNLQNEQINSSSSTYHHQQQQQQQHQQQQSTIEIPKGSYKKAFEHFQNAENLKPGFYSKNLLMLGKCSLALEKLQDAKNFLRKVTNFQVINREDQYCQKEAVELLKRIATIKTK